MAPLAWEIRNRTKIREGNLILVNYSGMWELGCQNANPDFISCVMFD